MQIDLSDIDPPGYLQLLVSGESSLANFRGVVDRIADESARSGRKRVYADLRGVKGALQDMDRYELGLYAAQKLQGLERFSILASPSHRINWFFEDTARNRGLAARVFLDEAEAKAWLTAP